MEKWKQVKNKASSVDSRKRNKQNDDDFKRVRKCYTNYSIASLLLRILIPFHSQNISYIEHIYLFLIKLLDNQTTKAGSSSFSSFHHSTLQPPLSLKTPKGKSQPKDLRQEVRIP